MFMCTYTLDTISYACFSVQTYWYTRFTVVPLIFFMLLVIACTCMPDPHHLIMHTCDCLSTPLGFIICTRGLHLTTLNSYVQILEYGLRWPYCSRSEGAAKAWISGCYRSPFLPASLLIGSRDFSCCSWAPLSFCYVCLFVNRTFVFLVM